MVYRRRPALSRVVVICVQVIEAPLTVGVFGVPAPMVLRTVIRIKLLAAGAIEAVLTDDAFSPKPIVSCVATTAIATLLLLMCQVSEY